MADPADLGAGGTQEYPNYADDEGKIICLAYFVCIWRRPIHFACPFVRMIACTIVARGRQLLGFFEFILMKPICTSLHRHVSLCAAFAPALCMYASPDTSLMNTF